jgi:glycosyltransferase involved in cell wall biosynthesis
MIRVTFVSAVDGSFVQDDLAILERHFAVRKRIGRGLPHLVRTFLDVFHSDVVYCWFASVYSFVAVVAAKLAGAKSIIVAGGVDLAKNRELRYGIWLSAWRAPLVRYAFRHADCVLVGDATMRAEAMRQASYNGANIADLLPGFDSAFWKQLGDKEPVVLTVANASDQRTVRVKGVDVLLEAARLLPDVHFVLVGIEEALASSLNPPPNVQIHHRVQRSNLLHFYRLAKVYCQPSRHEALGYALREAMLCECVPVASEVGGMTTAVAGVGLLVPPGAPGPLSEALLQALHADDEMGKKARARIVALYPSERHCAEVVRRVQELVR